MVCTCTVYDGTRDTPAESSAALTGKRRATIRWRSVDELLTGASFADEPTVIIANRALLERFDGLRTTPEHVVVIAADAATAIALGGRADVVTANVPDPTAQDHLLDAACCLAAARFENAHLKRELARVDDEYGEWNRIAMALMQGARSRRAPQPHRRAWEASDRKRWGRRAAPQHGQRRCRTTPARRAASRSTHCADVSLLDIRFAVDNTSVVGHAALTRKPVVVADAEALPPDSVFVASEEFKRRYGYPARSMLAVPMLTQRDEVLGVVFFINRKTDPNVSIINHADADRYVVPFVHRHVRLARSLASMAAISIENVRLYVQIEQILESFVVASVSAIDARDPTTAGHSLRVATLATSLADAVQHAGRGPYQHVRFTEEQMRELHFAALLHDIGKVAVREDVLVKAKKLPPLLWERIDARFGLIRRTVERAYSWRRAEACQSGLAERAERCASFDAQSSPTSSVSSNARERSSASQTSPRCSRRHWTSRSPTSRRCTFKAAADGRGLAVPHV